MKPSRTEVHILRKWSGGGAEVIVRDLCSSTSGSARTVRISQETQSGQPKLRTRLVAAHREARAAGSSKDVALLLHSASAIGVFVVLKFLLPRSKALFVAHGDYALSTPMSRFVMYFWLAAGGRVLAVSQAVKQSYPRRVQDGIRVFPIAYAAVNEIAAPSVRGALVSGAAHPQNYVSASRLAHPKDPETLIRGWAASKAHATARLTLFGSGGLLKHLETLISDLNLASIELVPFDAGLRTRLGEFDVFVLSSKSEGLPVSLLEAQAWGLPTVVSNVGGVPDVVHHGVNGFLVTPGSVPEMAAALDALLDLALARRLGGNGYSMFQANVRKYSYERFREILWDTE